MATNAQQVQPGAIVRLPSGGPEMTVVRVIEEPIPGEKAPTASCRWFDGENKLRDIQIPVEALEVVKQAEAPSKYGDAPTREQVAAQDIMNIARLLNMAMVYGRGLGLQIRMKTDTPDNSLSVRVHGPSSRVTDPKLETTAELEHLLFELNETILKATGLGLTAEAIVPENGSRWEALAAFLAPLFGLQRTSQSASKDDGSQPDPADSAYRCSKQGAVDHLKRHVKELNLALVFAQEAGLSVDLRLGRSRGVFTLDTIVSDNAATIHECCEP